MNKMYQLEFECVSPIGHGHKFYRGEEPNCKPSDVPDEFWTKVIRQTDSPRDQYNTLKKWAETGEQLIRNVKLYECVGEPVWKLVE